MMIQNKLHFLYNYVYPFGMLMPGRSYSTGAYKFGFNGKENDNEVKGTANQQDYGMRIYDTRLGKFLSVDPITIEYPELTPYQFASNRPIDGVDFDGLEYASYKIYVNKNNKVTKFQLSYTDYELKRNGSNGPGIAYTVIGHNGMPGDYNFVQNYHGIYQGPNNPQLPEIGGDPNIRHDVYDLPPIDETDEIAKQHDKDYDVEKISGLKGVLSNKSTVANEKYISAATKTIEKFEKKEKDNITGKTVTKGTAEAAKSGIKAFREAETYKKKPSPELKRRLEDNGPKY